MPLSCFHTGTVIFEKVGIGKPNFLGCLNPETPDHGIQGTTAHHPVYGKHAVKSSQNEHRAFKSDKIPQIPIHTTMHNILFLLNF